MISWYLELWLISFSRNMISRCLKVLTKHGNFRLPNSTNAPVPLLLPKHLLFRFLFPLNIMIKKVIVALSTLRTSLHVYLFQLEIRLVKHLDRGIDTIIMFG